MSNRIAKWIRRYGPTIVGVLLYIAAIVTLWLALKILMLMEEIAK